MACSSSQTYPPADPLTPVAFQTSNPDNQGTSTLNRLPQVILHSQKLNKIKQFSDAPDRDIFQLTKELVPGNENIPRTTDLDAKSPSVGHSETFWLIDMPNTKTYQSDFKLALITPNAYWYVENGLEVSMSGLTRSATQFEEDIYPVVTRFFGNEWNPGIDNDSRLYILNAKFAGIAGYFNSNDEYPTSVRPRSNQREIIYLNARDVLPGSSNYAQVLSHELQHAIHWNADASEDTWVNEGLSELASSIALDSTSSIHQFLQAGPTSLTNWPISSAGRSANYGAASLFMHFLTEHYGGRDNLKGLLAVPEDNIAGIDSYLENQGYTERFADVFKQWAAANILDDQIRPGDGILGYKELDVSAIVSESINNLKENQFEIPQYAVAYTELESISKGSRLLFKGETDTPLLPVDVGTQGCWWSNAGDSIDSTLSRQIRLKKGYSSTLEYEIWFEIEDGWDYVYVETSIDGGNSWQIIETSKMSSENPIGNGFGAGYTGKSEGWLADSVNLTSFKNEDVWVRFQYITDEAVNGAGACFRNLSIQTAEITPNDSGWEAEGFLLTDNLVPQGFQVQLITIGDKPEVRQMLLDSNNEGELTIHPPKYGEQLIVVVGSLANKTQQPASYTLRLKPAK